MIQTGFNTRIKVQDIIDNQLPEFILDENPKLVDFLKQYYISQEYQGGPTDISENIDQYLKLDNLTSEVISNSIELTSSIGIDDTVINVSNTKGFPKEYGLLKINDEIITYTDLTSTSFIGCVRGFSAITNYHDDENEGELIFTKTSSSSHPENSQIENLSNLFLKEIYSKIKYTFSPGFENREFVSDLNVGNFLKGINSFYGAKGTNESFKILLRVLFGVDSKIINLENYLIKPSSADYIRKEVLIVDKISGNPENLIGNQIYSNINPETNASVSSVEVLNTGLGEEYFKLNLFVGFDDSNSINGKFELTPNTKCIDKTEIGSSILTVDSTIGFEESGTIFSLNNTITYKEKSLNQFLGCSGIDNPILENESIYSEGYYYGYDDNGEKITIKINGVLNKLDLNSYNGFSLIENDIVSVDNIGDSVEETEFGVSKTNKQIFANSWIYNVRPSFNIFEINSSTIKIKTDVYRSQLKIGDQVEILDAASKEVIYPTNQNYPYVESIFSNGLETDIVLSNFEGFISNPARNYVIRRLINKAFSTIPFKYGNRSLVSDIQNIYFDADNFAYVSSYSLPSAPDTNNYFRTEITNSLKKSIINFSQENGTLSDLNETTGFYETITFNTDINFKSGEKIIYKSEIPITGLEDEKYYYVEVLGARKIKLHGSQNFIELGNSSEINFLYPDDKSADHIFIIESQKSEILNPQKLFKKFNLFPQGGTNKKTLPGKTGMLINGVEIDNYKTLDKIYYGPIENVKILNSGSNYDVINPPKIEISSGIGGTALVTSTLLGTVEDVFVDDQEFGIDKVLNVESKGGNIKGGNFIPIVEEKRREVLFDARSTNIGGGIDITTNQITFVNAHNFYENQEVIYRNNGNSDITIGIGLSTLKNNNRYYVKVDNSKTIRLFDSFNDSSSGINTITFSDVNLSGIQKFLTADKFNTVSEIKVIDGGQVTNKSLLISPSGISTQTNTINFKNHGFSTGELVEYAPIPGLGVNSPQPISGLSTENQYYVIKENSDSFMLCDAGIGGTYYSNFERKKVVNILSTGSGYNRFKYPDLEIVINYNPIGLGTISGSQLITTTPVVKGVISELHLYESGIGYGSSIINFHRKPTILIKNGIESRLNPLIINGQVISVNIDFGGSEYFSVPDLEVVDPSGKGYGAKLRAVIENERIVDVKIINSGIGYSSNSSINVIPSGINCIIDCNVRELTINQIQDNNNDNNQYEILKDYNGGLSYSVSGYYQNLQNSFQDDGNQSSSIIGWAYDGYPIYGPYGNSDPEDITSTRKLLKSSYILNTSNIIDRPSSSDFPAGYFIEDYSYDETSGGDLDEYNGRYEKNVDFPNGTYAYHASIDEISNKPTFPYFVGDCFKGKLLDENEELNQSFDFENSSLLRNTFPYKIFDVEADYDFVPENYNYSKQKIELTTVEKGIISDIEIFDGGENYKVGEKLIFKNSDSDNTTNKIDAEIGSIKGKVIEKIESIINEETNYTAVWNEGEIDFYISPYTEFESGDYVSINASTTTDIEYFDDLYQIKVISDLTETLIQDIPSGSETTEIYLSNVSNKVSAGSSIQIGGEVMEVLNVFPNKKVLRVKRGNSLISHSSGIGVTFKQNKITIKKEIDYFDSKQNIRIYFNPKESIGIGTTSGISYERSFNFGNETISRSIQTKTIHLENHPFKTNQRIYFNPNGHITPNVDNIQIQNTSTSTPYDLPPFVYVVDKNPNTIGIKTSLITDEVFIVKDGDNYDDYYFETVFNQENFDLRRIKAQVSLSTSHSLEVGDLVKLDIKPNLLIGSGISSDVKVLYNEQINKILIDPIEFNFSTDVDLGDNTITINNHGLNTGDKVFYDYAGNSSADKIYFVHKVDNNTINLCETLFDTYQIPVNVVDFNTISYSNINQSLSLINPKIYVVRNNDLKFDLSDSSLSGYNFNIYYDNNFNTEFISTGSTNQFNIIREGSPGTSSSYVTLEFSEQIPQKLFYSLKNNEGFVGPDKNVEDYSSISYIESSYNGEHRILGVGLTTFEISVRNVPERSEYLKSDCDIIQYTTTSKTEKGSADSIKILYSGGYFSEIPIFNGVNTQYGIGLNLIPKFNSIRKIKSFRNVTQSLPYSFDKTLSVNASISPKIILKDFNYISDAQVIYGGSGYTEKPEIIVVEKFSRRIIDNGIIDPIFNGSSITSLDIVSSPRGISSNSAELFATKNSNGVSILRVNSISPTIFEVVITTPIGGFITFPFLAGDQVFVEGIQKDSISGDGFNSSDYGYSFFKVLSYTPNGSIYGDVVTIDVSDLTTNTGIAKVIQDSNGSIINKNQYPVFSANISSSYMQIGEKLIVNGTITDLEVISNDSIDSLKVIGTYKLSKNDVIQGKESLNLSTIKELYEFEGIFSKNYSYKENDGWSSDIGKLNVDYQVLGDNDYYQNLSYSIQSPIEWEKLKSPVNKFVHTSGLKNFADTNVTSIGERTGISSSANEVVFYNILSDEKRVDTINVLDLVTDIDVVENSSKFVKLKTIKLSDYVNCDTNKVLPVDDISSLFKNNFDSENISVMNYFESYEYYNYLIKASNINSSEVQLSNLVILFNKNTDNIYISERYDVTNSGTELNENFEFVDFLVETNSDGKKYLFITAKDDINSDYDIKYIEKRFSSARSFTAGYGVQDIGYIDIIAVTKRVLPSTFEISTYPLSETISLHVSAYVKDLVNNISNFVELYITHDGTNTYISENYIDTSNISRNDYIIGRFDSIISGSNLVLNYVNNTNFDVLIDVEITNFKNITSGNNFYRFLSGSQIPGTEKSAFYQSNLNTISVTPGNSGNVINLDSINIDAVESLVHVGYGQSSSLYKLHLVQDGTNIHLQEAYSINIDDNFVGVGTFGTQYNLNNTFDIVFYPNTAESYTVVSFNKCFYKLYDFSNQPDILNIGPLITEFKSLSYFSKNSSRASVKEFELKFNGKNIFSKSFDPSNLINLNPSTGKFTFDSHFFSPDEEVIYTADDTFDQIPISLTYRNNLEGVEDLLPSSVFIVNPTDTEFQISTTRSGIAVTFVDIGTGNNHRFTMKKKNEKILVTLNDITQYPPIDLRLDKTLVQNITSEVEIFSLSGISSINPLNVLKIDDEYMNIINVGLGTTNSGPILNFGSEFLVQVERGIWGSNAAPHSIGANVQTYTGSFNIVDNKIFFNEEPVGSSSLSERNESNLVPYSYDFSSRVFLRNDYSSNQIFDDISPQFDGVERTFTLTVGGGNTSGLGTGGGNGFTFINGVFQTPTTERNLFGNFEITEEISPLPGITTITFTGIRSDISDPESVVIFDADINQNNIPRGGIIVSLGSSDGIGYAPLVGASVIPEVTGGSITNIIGISTYTGSPYSITTSTYNNQNGNFEVTVDSDFDYSTSFVYLEGLEFSCTSGAGTTTIFPDGTQGNYFPITKILSDRTFISYVGTSTIPHTYIGGGVAYRYDANLTFGSGYNGLSPIEVTIYEEGHSGNNASIEASVGIGGTLIFTINDGGSGYTSPEIFTSEPSYENLEIVGVSRLGVGNTTETGTGLLLNISVDSSNSSGIGSTYFSVTDFSISRNGYSFRKGDVFKPVGLVTDSRLSSPISELIFTVLETYRDTFATFQYGDFEVIDSVKFYQDGSRTIFPLYYNGDLLSFESSDEIIKENFSDLLLIVINGIIQYPKKAYFFNGGTSFQFITPPKPEDDIDIYFYLGSSGVDAVTITDVIPVIERGDIIQIFRDNNNSDTLTQDPRTVYDLSFSDKFETNKYSGVGIDINNERPMSLTRQKEDKIINGVFVNKTRNTIISQIYPTAKVIKDFLPSDNEIFIDDSSIFKYEGSAPYNFEFLVVDNINSSTGIITTQVGSSGSITSINIIDGGSGYTGSSVDIIFSNPPEIGVGIGTTVLASIPISSAGILTTPINIINPGFGYSFTPYSIVPEPELIIENVGTTQGVQGFNGTITGIGTTVSSGQLSLVFNLDRGSFFGNDLEVGYPILIKNTNLGYGVTSVDGNDSNIIGIGTTTLDNIYYVDLITDNSGNSATIYCNVHSSSDINGISSTGQYLGEFSWGRLYTMDRTEPISIAVTNKTVDVGLSTFPVVQRRDTGLRNTGALIEKIII